MLFFPVEIAKNKTIGQVKKMIEQDNIAAAKLKLYRVDVTGDEEVDMIKRVRQKLSERPLPPLLGTVKTLETIFNGPPKESTIHIATEIPSESYQLSATICLA